MPISHKLSNKISHVWNYLGIYSCFETQFSKNRVSNVKLATWASCDQSCAFGVAPEFFTSQRNKGYELVFALTYVKVQLIHK